VIQVTGKYRLRIYTARRVGPSEDLGAIVVRVAIKREENRETKMDEGTNKDIESAARLCL
jgi:ribosomal protein L15E